MKPPPKAKRVVPNYDDDEGIEFRDIAEAASAAAAAIVDDVSEQSHGSEFDTWDGQ
jgi:hypothetical protein